MIERRCPQCRKVVEVIRVAIVADGEVDHDELRCEPGGHLFVDPSPASYPLGRGRRGRAGISPLPPRRLGPDLPS